MDCIDSHTHLSALILITSSHLHILSIWSKRAVWESGGEAPPHSNRRQPTGVQQEEEVPQLTVVECKEVYFFKYSSWYASSLQIQRTCTLFEHFTLYSLLYLTFFISWHLRGNYGTFYFTTVGAPVTFQIFQQIFIPSLSSEIHVSPDVFILNVCGVTFFYILRTFSSTWR